MGNDLGRDDELLGVEAVARALGVRPVTVYRWCRQGRLPCLKPGKAWRVRRSALAAFLRGFLSDEAAGDEQPVWVGLDWAEEVGLDGALRQQAELAELVAAHPVVATTGVVEPAAATWPPAEQQWRLLRSVRGVVRFARAGLVLSRVVPPPAA